MAHSADVSREQQKEISAARTRAARSLRTRPHARTASYSTSARTVTVVLTNGAAFSIPVAMIPGLANAKDADLRAVTVGPAGVGLCWGALDVDVSVVALARLILGPHTFMRAAGAAGGAVRSRAKAIAARENGKKGGRPRKSINHAD
jgi:Protein of unknown function (DUF2442)